MIKILSFSINVEQQTSLIAIPERQNIANSFDYSAISLGLTRNNNESNIDIRNKIWDASIHPAGPTYYGNINSISRDFGFLRQKAFSIDLKLKSDGTPIADSPRVEMYANRIVLYKDWRPSSSIIDKEIRTYKQEDEGFYLQGLIDEINSSECFSATLESGIRTNILSSCIVRRNSYVYVSQEGLTADKRTILSYGNIAKESISFYDKTTFKIEVSSEPNATNEYQVDYKNGIITSYDLPKINNFVSYYANIFPLELDITPIQIFSLNDENFTTELFDKKVLDSGEEINSLLNHEGASIYHQLYTEVQTLWGK